MLVRCVGFSTGQDFVFFINVYNSIANMCHHGLLRQFYHQHVDVYFYVILSGLNFDSEGRSLL